MTTTIYLAGPVANADDGGAAWRERLEEQYGHDGGVEFLNPLDKYNAPADDLTIVEGVSDPDDDETVGDDEIVRSDKQLILGADAVLVGYEAVHSVGTPMEVMYAHEREMPVALWIRDETVPPELSPWHRHHAGCITYLPGVAVGHLVRESGGER